MPGLDGPPIGIATLLRRLAFRPYCAQRMPPDRRSEPTVSSLQRFRQRGWEYSQAVAGQNDRAGRGIGQQSALRRRKILGKMRHSLSRCRRHAGKYTAWVRLASRRRYCRLSARSPSHHSVVRDGPASTLRCRHARARSPRRRRLTRQPPNGLRHAPSRPRDLSGRPGSSNMKLCPDTPAPPVQSQTKHQAHW